MDLDGRLISLKRRRMLVEPSGVGGGAEEKEDVLQIGSCNTRERHHTGGSDARDHPGTHATRERDNPGHRDSRERDHTGSHNTKERGHPGIGDPRMRDHPGILGDRERGTSEIAADREGRSAASDQTEPLQQKLQAFWTMATCEMSPGQVAASGEGVADSLITREHAPRLPAGRNEAEHPSRSDALHQSLSRKRRNTPREWGHDYPDIPYSPRNGEGTRDWLGRLTGEDPTWAEARAGRQVSAYAHPYLYPLSLCGQQTHNLGGMLHTAHPTPEDASMPAALRQIGAHCHHLVGAKQFEGLPIPAHQMDPVSALEELTYSSCQAPLVSTQLEKGPPSLGESRFLAANWHPGLYPMAWNHPLCHLRSQHGASPQPALENGLSAKLKECSNRKENIVHLLAKDPPPSTARSPPGPPSSCPSSGPGEARLGPDHKMEALPCPESRHEPSWRGEIQQAEACRTLSQGNTAASDTQSYWSAFPVHPGPTGSETSRSVASEWPAGSPHQPVTASPESKEEVCSDLAHQSRPSGSRQADRFPVLFQTVERCHGTKATLGGPGCGSEVPTSRSQSDVPCDNTEVRGGKRTHEGRMAPDGRWDGKPCSLVGMSSPVEMHGKLGHGSKAGKVLALAGPPRNHTKLKQTWLTRHSEQFSCHASDAMDQGDRSNKVPEKDDVVGVKELGGCHQQATNQPSKPISEETSKTGPSSICAAKRSCTGTENHWADGAGSDQVVPAQGAEPKDLAEPKDRMDPGDDQDAERDPASAQPKPTRVSLQTVPCSLLPETIERCCSCASRSQEAPSQAGCRFLHFRRLALRCGGRLEADGLSTLDEVSKGSTSEPGSGDGRAREGARSPSPAKYLLSTLGDQFCEIVRRDREALSRSKQDSELAVAWRKVRTGPQACDACYGAFFNSHWSCSRCGFQMCAECYRSKEKMLGKEPQGDEVPTMKCVRGPEHSLRFLVPTQFISTHVLSDLWKAMHDIRLKYDISSNCHCRQTFLTDAVLLGISLSKEEVKRRQAPPPQATDHKDTMELKAIKQECTEPVEQSLSDQGPKGTVQSLTLCDLLTSTAVKLCLGQTGVRMAFAPVSPALPTDDRISSILDNIIAQVVERKIQEKQQVKAGGARSPSPPEPTLYYPAPQGGILWLQDPSDTSNYRRFQEHWRQCQQPVLVSGLNKKMKRSLWGPGPLSRELGQQLAAVHPSRTPCTAEPINSKQLWDNFIASTGTLRDEKSRGSQWRWEWDLGELRPSWMENLNSCLPLPEYCHPGGKLNLASYLPGDQLWLCPRIAAVHGMKLNNRSFGTKKLAAEVTDFLNLLVHVDDPGEAFSDGCSFQQEILLRTEGDGTDGLLKEQLWGSRDTPGALWHIFQAEDAEQIRRFLEKVCGDQAKPGVSQTSPSDQQSCYLDLPLRKRLREECGVKSWALLQFLGDAVVVPAGSPYQVQSFTNTISVTQGFLSPENTPLSAHLMRTARKTQPSTHNLFTQMEGAIFGAVKDAVETLQAYN